MESNVEDFEKLASNDYWLISIYNLFDWINKFVGNYSTEQLQCCDKQKKQWNVEWKIMIHLFVEYSHQ